MFSITGTSFHLKTSKIFCQTVKEIELIKQLKCERKYGVWGLGPIVKIYFSGVARFVEVKVYNEKRHFSFGTMSTE